MLGLIPETDGRPLELLLIGAHPDDLEIGCGGTVLRWAREGRIARATWVVLSGEGAREDEARRSAERFLVGAAGSRIAVEHFRDGYFPFEGEGLKDAFERIKGAVAPDVVLTHGRDDRHQDHRFVSDLTWQTFRDHLILEYEIPKFDGELRHPDVYVELSQQDAADKARMVLDGFPSQRDREWFTAETFTGLARLRGIECRSATGLAEGFVGRKILIR
jgi:LmbE family N-acetylglucosaminyl deacetylase